MLTTFILLSGNTDLMFGWNVAATFCACWKKKGEHYVLLQAYVSMKRVTNMLMQDELDPASVGHHWSLGIGLSFSTGYNKLSILFCNDIKRTVVVYSFYHRKCHKYREWYFLMGRSGRWSCA